MAITKDQKQKQVADLTEKFQKAQSVMFAHYIGLTVAEVDELRNKLRESNAEMKVAKKTLMQIAAKQAGLPVIEESALEGPVSCIFSFDDPLSGAQIAFKFAKEHDQVQLIGGMFDGKTLSKAEAVAMASMPSRSELLAIFASMLQAPLRNFMSMSNGPLSGFARGLSQMADKGGFVKEEAVSTPETPTEAPAEPAAEEAAPASEEVPAETPTEEAPAAAEATPAEETPAEDEPKEDTPQAS